MKKLGRTIKKKCPTYFHHQLCFAHGLHLAVLDTFKVATATEDEAADDRDDWRVIGMTSGVQRRKQPLKAPVAAGKAATVGRDFAATGAPVAAGEAATVGLDGAITSEVRRTNTRS